MEEKDLYPNGVKMNHNFEQKCGWRRTSGRKHYLMENVQWLMLNDQEDDW